MLQLPGPLSIQQERGFRPPQATIDCFGQGAHMGGDAFEMAAFQLKYLRLLREPPPCAVEVISAFQ